MKKLLGILFLLLCGNVAAYSNDRDVRLNQLFEQLKKSNNNSVAFEIEMKIWNIWSTHPNQKELTESLAKGSNLMCTRPCPDKAPKCLLSRLRTSSISFKES